MKGSILVIVSFILLHFFEYSTGAVFHDELKKEIVYGKKVKFCEYKGLRLLRRSVIKNYDTCAKCRCKKDGLTCYTMFPLIMEPEDSMCTYFLVGCKVKWVLKSDNNARCPDTLIPRDLSANGK
ncbi:uncharacterized protein LOC123562874 [Mercenaria mercenaria]|uniref:uncharacterized protein LOC123562874 n=1 Tax=Mercenaria mercenaria TaxID=6596 RepID=UPI00234EC4F1|nr:uncharacterized protein LOC123562874 [Mercenaria mercenaria]